MHRPSISFYLIIPVLARSASREASHRVIFTISLYFLAVRSKCPHQHPIPEHPQPTCFA